MNEDYLFEKYGFKYDGIKATYVSKNGHEFVVDPGKNPPNEYVVNIACNDPVCGLFTKRGINKLIDLQLQKFEKEDEFEFYDALKNVAFKFEADRLAPFIKNEWNGDWNKKLSRLFEIQGWLMKRSEGGHCIIFTMPFGNRSTDYVFRIYIKEKDFFNDFSIKKESISISDISPGNPQILMPPKCTTEILYRKVQICVENLYRVFNNEFEYLDNVDVKQAAANKKKAVGYDMWEAEDDFNVATILKQYTRKHNILLTVRDMGFEEEFTFYKETGYGKADFQIPVDWRLNDFDTLDYISKTLSEVEKEHVFYTYPHFPTLPVEGRECALEGFRALGDDIIRCIDKKKLQKKHQQ